MFSRSSNDAGGRAVLAASHPRVTIHSRHRDISCVARHQRDADTPHLARGFSKKLLLFCFFFASFLLLFYGVFCINFAEILSALVTHFRVTVAPGSRILPRG